MRRTQVTDSKARAALQSSQATLLRAQADAARVVREKKLSVRYHKVKFFGAPPRDGARPSRCW